MPVTLSNGGKPVKKEVPPKKTDEVKKRKPRKSSSN